MQLSIDGEHVSSYEPMYSGKKIVIGIDSSKSNTAITVGDSMGNVYHDHELSGAGGDVNVYDFCRDMRRELKSLFKGADILKVGIEDIITKKEKGYRGIEIHQSRYKITAVFDNLIFLFDDYFGIMPTLVNNWAWKAAILPEEYRTKDHKKGSLDWFNAIGNRWAGRKDDVTDSVCIYYYLLKVNPVKPIYTIRETSPSNISYACSIFPDTFTMPDSAKEFIIDNTDSLEHNLAMIAEMLGKEFGYVKVSTEMIPIDWIYSDRLKYNNTVKFQRNAKEVLVVVNR